MKKLLFAVAAVAVAAFIARKHLNAHPVAKADAPAGEEVTPDDVAEPDTDVESSEEESSKC